MNAKVAALEAMGISHQCAVEMVALSLNSARDEMVKRVPVETWSRVCGFFRPVSGFNLGKQEEFRERKTYKIKEDV